MSLCFKDCYKCSSPYKVSAQRYCYDYKIDYLFKNPLIERKQQKKNPTTKKNEIAYTFECGGFETKRLLSMSGELLEQSNINDITMLTSLVIDLVAYEHITNEKQMAYSSNLKA